MKIVGALRIYTFVNDEVLTVFFRNEGVATVRTEQTHRSSNIFSSSECLTANLALILTIAAIVVVDVMMRSTTERTDGVLRNGFTIFTLDRLWLFSILPFIVFEKELPILFDERFYDRKLVNFKLLVLWRMGIIESPLFKRNISANKI